MLSNCKISVLGKGFVQYRHMHDYTSFFFLPCYPTSPFLFSVLSMQNKFTQASLNPNTSECSPNWEGPEKKVGFVCPSTLGGKTRLEDTVVIAVARYYTSFGLITFLFVIYIFILVFYIRDAGIIFFFCGLKIEFPWLEEEVV